MAGGQAEVEEVFLQRDILIFWISGLWQAILIGCGWSAQADRW